MGIRERTTRARLAYYARPINVGYLDTRARAHPNVSACWFVCRVLGPDWTQLTCVAVAQLNLPNYHVFGCNVNYVSTIILLMD